MKIITFSTFAILYICLSPCYGVENKLGALVIQCDNVLDEFINRNFDSNLLSKNNDYNNYREFFHLCDTQKKIAGWSQSVEEKINYILNRIPRQASLNSTSETNTVINMTTTNITTSADNPVLPINETTKQKSDNNTKEKQNAEESDFNSTAIIKKSSHSISISNHETKKQNNTIPQDKGDPIVESFKSVSAASNYSFTVSSTTPSNGTVQQNDDKHIQNIIIQSSDKSVDYWTFVLCVLALTILTLGTVFTIYRKWHGRFGFYQIGDICQCRSNNETPV